MTPPHLYILGIDPGETTGWALLKVPRYSIYGRDPGEILEVDWGEFTGPENVQVRAIAVKARETQGLDYQIGPAIVGEDFDLMACNPTTDAAVLLSPVRIMAKVDYAQFNGELSDAHVVLQSRSLAKSTATDDRLEAWGLYDKHSGPHARDAMRHAITALRRAKAKPDFRSRLWNEPPGVLRDARQRHVAN